MCCRWVSRTINLTIDTYRFDDYRLSNDSWTETAPNQRIQRTSPLTRETLGPVSGSRGRVHMGDVGLGRDLGFNPRCKVFTDIPVLAGTVRGAVAFLPAPRSFLWANEVSPSHQMSPLPRNQTQYKQREFATIDKRHRAGRARA